MVQKIIGRNIVLYILLGLILAGTVDWATCFRQRGKYLLGIFYNGHFENQLDGAVYLDFLKRHGTDPDTFRKTL